jgi:hypothetical protein
MPCKKKHIHSTHVILLPNGASSKNISNYDSGCLGEKKKKPDDPKSYRLE